MKMSAAVEWALHACVSLTQASGPIPAGRLATLHGTPPAYLAKNLQALSKAGIVQSFPGVVGGYRLTRAPSEITALDIVSAIEGDEPVYRCAEIRARGPLAVPPERCATTRCAIARAMDDAERAWREALGAITIDDLASGIDADSGGDALDQVRDWLAS